MTGRRTLVVVLLALLAQAPARALDTSAVETPEGSGTTAPSDCSRPRRLVGTVRSQAGSASIQGARVWPVGDPDQAVLTDETGTFLLAVSSWCSEGFRVAAPGHRTATRSWPSEEEPSRESFLVWLGPTYTLAGTVVDGQGRPVEGADVRVETPDLAWSLYLDPRHRAEGRVTGADGRFRIVGLDPRYILAVVVTHPRYAPIAVDITAPSGPRGTEPGQVATVRLTLPRGAVLRGTVADLAGRPVAGARVALASDRLHQGAPTDPQLDHAVPSTATTDDDGAFRIEGLPPGPAVLAIEARGHATRLLPDLEIPDGTLDLGTLSLAPEALLAGRVSDPDGAPVAGATVTLHRQIRKGDRAVSDYVLSPPTDGAGRFRLDGLEPGASFDVEVEAEGFSAWAVRHVAVPPAEPLEVVLSPVASIEGSVVDGRGQGISGAWVDATIASGTSTGGAGSFQRARTDSSGRFRLNGLAAGEATLTVTASEHYLEQPVTVPLATGETVRAVELSMTAGASISGRVLGASLEPLAGARVSGTGSTGFTDVDGQGRYRLTGLRPGKLTLAASAPGHLQIRETVDLGHGDEVLDFVLESGIAVSGRVVRSTGEPVAGALVRLRALSGTDPDQGLAWAQAETTSTGSFEASPLPDGRFKIVVFGPQTTFGERSAWRYEAPEPVLVAGEAITGLEIRLPQTTTIRGRILGLSAEELAEVSVGASDALYYFPSSSGVVHANGTFEIPDLLPGDWRVGAGTPDGRAAFERLETVEGVPEVWVDLVFTDAPPG